jgi:hypothetical protein
VTCGSQAVAPTLELPPKTADPATTSVVVRARRRLTPDRRVAAAEDEDEDEFLRMDISGSLIGFERVLVDMSLTRVQSVVNGEHSPMV